MKKRKKIIDDLGTLDYQLEVLEHFGILVRSSKNYICAGLLPIENLWNITKFDDKKYNFMGEERTWEN